MVIYEKTLKFSQKFLTQVLVTTWRQARGECSSCRVYKVKRTTPPKLWHRHIKKLVITSINTGLRTFNSIRGDMLYNKHAKRQWKHARNNPWLSIQSILQEWALVLVYFYLPIRHYLRPLKSPPSPVRTN